MSCNRRGSIYGIKAVFGLLIISAGVYYQSWWGAVGAIILITGIINFCPLYLPFGISSCKKG
ncbi:MAG: YgaP family membrane protein [Alteromonas oceani]